MESILSLRNVWLEYDDKVVLERVDLDVSEGEFVLIVGPSGAGKSSLLRVVLGQEAPTAGQILLDGQPMPTECGPDRGIVFQRYSVFPHLTAIQNVLVGLEYRQSPLLGKLFGRRRAAAQAQARDMLAAVGLADHADAYPARLSGGMQQRLAIAQALVTRPRILLLDEPFGALDPGIRADMHRLITRLWREQGLTILMITHDIKEAFALGTRVLTIDKRRHDPHEPHRYGSTAVYDLRLDRKDGAAIAAEEITAEGVPATAGTDSTKLAVR